MSAYDVNEVAILGLDRAIQEAAKRWEDAGAPVGKGVSDETRERFRAIVRGEVKAEARPTYAALIHWTEQKTVEDARLARAAEQQRRRAERQTTREAMTAEMRSIRERLGISAAEMDARLGVKAPTCNNAEKATGSTALDLVASLLRRYRVEAKLASVGAESES